MTRSCMMDMLEDDYLMLPQQLLPMTGVAAQTLGALYRTTRGGEKPTFASRKYIADMACRPLRSAARDLDLLVSMGLVVNQGREPFTHKSHKVRRTNTYSLSKQAVEGKLPYLQAPRWSLSRLQRWSDRVVFAAIVTRHLLIQRLAIEENHGREGYSAADIARDTGLSLRSVKDAKNHLRCLNYIDVWPGYPDHRDNGQFYWTPDEPRLNPNAIL